MRLASGKRRVPVHEDVDVRSSWYSPIEIVADRLSRRWIGRPRNSNLSRVRFEAADLCRGELEEGVQRGVLRRLGGGPLAQRHEFGKRSLADLRRRPLISGESHQVIEHYRIHCALHLCGKTGGRLDLPRSTNQTI